MLTIRSEQIQILRALAMNVFIQENILKLRESDSSRLEIQSDDNLEEFIMNAISAVKRCGVTTLVDVASFIAFCGRHDMDSQPEKFLWVSNILNDPKIDPDDKIDELLLREQMINLHS